MPDPQRTPSAFLMERHPHLAEACGASVDAAFERIAAAFADGHKLLLCGNGGSAADCDHIVGELMKGFRLPRPFPTRRARPSSTRTRRVGHAWRRCCRVRSPPSA